jgi:tRNA/rRNA methyltransferase
LPPRYPWQPKGYDHFFGGGALLKGKTKNISIVLYKPKYAGNVGSVARVAKNMGIGSIIIVGAADLDRAVMQQRSTHLAADMLEQIQYFDNIETALGSFNYIVGTTARLGKARGPFVSPRTAAQSVAGILQKNNVALLFGPEDAGLANEQLRFCHCVVTIPTSREFTSLNLSHAVMIMCYEIFIASTAAATKTTETIPKLAISSELEGMYGQIKTLLADIGFLNPENPDYWMLHLRRFFSRAGLLSREVKIIRGICRQLTWYAHHKKT